MALADFLLSVVASAGGGAVVAAALFRGFGTRWLDSRFARQLQDLRHEHERQIENVRAEASRILDRTTRLNEREFEVTAEAWSLVYETYGRTISALPGVTQQPDFSRISDAMASRVAEANDFEDWEVDHLLTLAAAARNAYFGERVGVHRIFKAKDANRIASAHLAKEALFIEKDVHDRLTSFVDDAWKAVADLELVRELREHGPLPDGMRRTDEQFRSTAETRVKELEQFARSRFWPSS